MARVKSEPKVQGDIIRGGKENLGQGNVVAAATEAAPVPALPQRFLNRAEVVLPLEPLTLVNCRWRDGKYYPARIVERRELLDAEPGAYEYYVHYRNLNRRMDEWVPVENLDLDTVVYRETFDPNDPKSKRQRIEEEHSEDDGEHEGISAQRLREHEEFTKVKNVGKIELGRYEMETWYFSPLPPEFNGVKTLYFCEYDLAFFKRRDQMVRHLRKVRIQHPPGTEIYRHNGICMFEVDGKREREYSQNLCYLAKLFLDHKTLYYDADAFLFYIMCEYDERGSHLVGYFSKEKNSEDGCNLACILTLPAYQRRGYGKFLISFSYELSKLEKKVGTPERPLSDLGLVSYRGYWTRVLLNILKDTEGPVSITELSQQTMIKPEDIVSTLQHLNMVQYVKGQHVLCAAPHVIEAHLKACGSPGLVVEPAKIVWSPFIGGKDG